MKTAKLTDRRSEFTQPNKMNNTPTPRTQAAVIASDGQWSFVLKDCSQQLETELAEVTRQRDRLAGIDCNILT